MAEFSWQPVRHEIIKNPEIADTVHNIGYTVCGNIGEPIVSILKTLYARLHDFKTTDGGMFYSLYSLNLDYRKQVHDEINEILTPVYNQYFSNWKSVINSFIVKLSGSQSEFTLHQDSSGLDETKYSPLSVWIPLQDTSIESGCLCVVPKTHSVFYPYRGISFPSPFSEIEEEVRKYLIPIEMKAGDILIFDNRLVHYSPPNNGKTDRITVMSGLFPESAKIQVCYKDETVEDSPIEIYEQLDDYLLTNKTFFHDCTCRPEVGKKVNEINFNLKPFTAEDFRMSMKISNVAPSSIKLLMNQDLKMNIVSEPAQ